MKKHIKFLFTILLLLAACQPLFSQSHSEEESHDFKHFRAAAAIGHAYIPKAKSENSTVVVIPTFGLDLQYWFNHKWGIALKNDLEIATYRVEDKNNNTGELVREYPFIVALPVLFSPWEGRGFNFILGPGIEFEDHENFSVFRVGVGSEFEIGNHWDFAPEIIYDLKDGHINSLTLAIGIGKRF